MRVLYSFLTAVLVVCYGGSLWRITRNSSTLTPLLGWWVGLGYFLVVPLSAMALLGGYSMPPSYEVGQAWNEVSFHDTSFLLPYLIVWLSLLGACLAIYICMPSMRPEGDGEPVISEHRLQRVLIITMAMTVLDCLVTIRLVGGIETFVVSHWYERGEDLVASLGDSYVLLSHLSMANQVIFTSAAALYTGLLVKHGRIKKTFLLLVVLFFLLEVVMTGNRIHVAIYLLALLVFCALYPRKKVIVGLLISAPVLALVFSAWSAIRHDLSDIPQSVSSYADADHDSYVTTSLFNVVEGVDTLLLMHVVRDFGTRFEYLHGESYSRLALSFIPRSVYPGKPSNLTAVMAELYLPNVLTSLNVTEVGEMYANFGPLTLLLFPLFTVGVIALSRWTVSLRSLHPLLPSVLFTLMIWTARVTLADSFLIFVLAFVMMSLFRMERGLCEARHVGTHAATFPVR
jgi:hypothetical protein